MKKICLVLLSLVSAMIIQAQHQVDSFFDDMGSVNMESNVDVSLDVMVDFPHRKDDIAWHRSVYRVIDMCEKFLYPNIDNGIIYEQIEEFTK
mgnify:CR=1 FL=1